MSKLSNEEVSDSFEEALENGEVTDAVGEKMSKDDFMTLDPKKVTETIFQVLSNSRKRLEGRLLTIIDATSDKERAKYIKDLIKSEIRSESSNNLVILSECFDDNLGLSPEERDNK